MVTAAVLSAYLNAWLAVRSLRATGLDSVRLTVVGKYNPVVSSSVCVDFLFKLRIYIRVYCTSGLGMYQRTVLLTFSVLLVCFHHWTIFTAQITSPIGQLTPYLLVPRSIRSVGIGADPGFLAVSSHMT